MAQGQCGQRMSQTPAKFRCPTHAFHNEFVFHVLDHCLISWACKAWGTLSGYDMPKMFDFGGPVTTPKLGRTTHKLGRTTHKLGRTTVSPRCDHAPLILFSPTVIEKRQRHKKPDWMSNLNLRHRSLMSPHCGAHLWLMSCPCLIYMFIWGIQKLHLLVCITTQAPVQNGVTCPR